VQHAKHLGVLLDEAPRTGLPEPEDARKRIAEWQQEALAGTAALSSVKVYPRRSSWATGRWVC
jgi:hypothetical protein